MMNWLGPALGVDSGLSTKIRVGDLVKHCGTKQWGKVLEVHPRGPRSAELVIERIKKHESDDTGKGWWATYHVLDWEPTYDVPR